MEAGAAINEITFKRTSPDARFQIDDQFVTSWLVSAKIAEVPNF